MLYQIGYTMSYVYLCIVYAYACLFECVWNYSVYVVGVFFIFFLMFTFCNYLKIVTFVDEITGNPD